MTTTPDLTHGTWTAYRRNGCRCIECRRYQNRYSTASRLRKMSGQPTWIPRTTLTDHIATLINSGMTIADIARVAGKTPGSLRETLHHRSDRILATYANAILRVTPTTPVDSVAQVPALGAQRRLRALARMGYNLDHIHNATGLSYVTMSHVRSGKKQTVAAQFHHRLAVYYDQVHMRRGPNDKTAIWAAKQKWFPPLAWDNIDTDKNETPWINIGHNTARFRPL